MPLFGGAFSTGESAEGVEDFVAIEFTFFFAHAGDLAEFGDGAGLGLADGVEGGVVENDEGGDHFLAGGVSAPLAEEFAEFFVHPNGWIQFVCGGFEDAVGILDWRGFSGWVLVDTGEPLGSASADVADSAAIPLRHFAEVSADFFLPAFLRADKLLDLVVSIPGAVFFLGAADLVDKESVQAVVFPFPENVAVRGQAIAPGAAGFLIELFDAFGQAEADHGADVWFVNAEAESDGADEHASFFAHPLFLIFAASGGVHLAVIADGGDAVFFEQIDDFTDTGYRWGIDDDVAVFHFFHGFHNAFVLHGSFALADEVAEVFAAEAGDGFEGVAEVELVDDVVADLAGGAGGEGRDGMIGEKSAELAELAVFGAEVVAPLGDAMGFVDGEEGERDLLEPLGGAVHEGALGGDVHEAVFASDGFLFEFAAVGFDDGAVEEDGGDAHLAELRDLVLHEGDQRRDDYGGAVLLKHGGKLVAERFAATGGHDDADVAARGEGADDFFLAGTEGVVAPVALEGVEEAGIGDGWAGEGCGVGHRELRVRRVPVGREAKRIWEVSL